MHVARYVAFAVCAVFFCLTPGNVRSEGREIRGYQDLTREELNELSRLENVYLNGVRDEALGLVTIFFDTHTIMSTFTPQARIIRQRRRAELNDVLRYLCAAGLEQEFISSYINRLRDDAVDYAVDGMLRKTKTLRRK